MALIGPKFSDELLPVTGSQTKASEFNNLESNMTGRELDWGSSRPGVQITPDQITPEEEQRRALSRPCVEPALIAEEGQAFSTDADIGEFNREAGADVLQPGDEIVIRTPIVESQRVEFQVARVVSTSLQAEYPAQHGIRVDTKEGKRYRIHCLTPVLVRDSLFKEILVKMRKGCTKCRELRKESDNRIKGRDHKESYGERLDRYRNIAQQSYYETMRTLNSPAIDGGTVATFPMGAT